MPLAGRAKYTVDYKRLASRDTAFEAVWIKSGGHLDYQDPETCKVLAQATLKVDFGLTLDLPADRLCPPIPNRWSYVAWIQDLIDSTSPGYLATHDAQRKVTGLDIGTGASAIYSLLSLKTRPNWTMCATDVDKKSFDSAARNLVLNGLIARTKILQTMKADPLIPIDCLGVRELDFTMCNPPFFADEAEMRASLKGEGKSWKPNAVCTGSANEMICSGGESAFVSRMVSESLVLKERVTWYSSMLGKLSSAKVVVERLKSCGVNNWAVGCLEPGDHTRRWIIAWSFGDLRPRNDIARHDSFEHSLLPFPTQYNITLTDGHDITTAKETINAQLSELELQWSWDPETSTGIGGATQNVWKRAYRREQQRRQKAGEVDVHQSDNAKVTLAFRIAFLEPKRIVIDWLRGSDPGLWESFTGLVHRNFRQVSGKLER